MSDTDEFLVVFSYKEGITNYWDSNLNIIRTDDPQARVKYKQQPKVWAGDYDN